MVECRDRVRGPHRTQRPRGAQQPGAVIEDVDDLDRRAIRERPVGRVHLPELVGQARLETDPGRARPFVWLRHHQTRTSQHAPDRGDRGRASERALQVPVQGQRASIKPLRRELRTQREDRGLGPSCHRARGVPRSARARDQAGLTLVPIPLKELVQPAAVHAVCAGELADWSTFPQMRLDEEPRRVHRRPSSRPCLRCVDTSRGQLSPIS